MVKTLIFTSFQIYTKSSFVGAFLLEIDNLKFRDMKKKTENKFFGLDTSEKAKIVRQAVDKATKEQLEMVNRHGGIEVLKRYSLCK